MQASNVPMRKWGIAIYLCLTSLKSVSSMKLSRDIGVKQSTAWFMLHRIRQAWADDDDEDFDGPVEVDETYMGGERKNMSNAKRRAFREAGSPRGPVDKTAVVGVRDRETNEIRAEVVRRVDGATLQGFVRKHTEPVATVHTDETAAYKGRRGTSTTRNVSEFAGKHNHRESGTLVQMRDTVARLVGRNLLYRDLIADNGLSSGARS